MLLKAFRDPLFLTHDPLKAEIIQTNKRLLEHPNVIVTPHCGFFSREGVQTLLQTTEENILAFLSGAPQNLIDIDPAVCN